MSVTFVTRSRAAALLTIVTVMLCRPAAAMDAVVEWNLIGEEASTVLHPSIRGYIPALAHLAIHDALNAIEPRYRQYIPSLEALPGASPEAAIAAAAYVVLSHLAPSHADALTTIYEHRIAELPDCPADYPSCITDGIGAGEAAAQAILALRAGDGSDTPNLPYTLAPGPGIYQRTPPAFADPLFAGWAHVTPLALRSGSQFRAEASEIFDLTGEAYTRDFSEVKKVGAAMAEAVGDRTPEQSAIARFWPFGGANLNAVTRIIAAGRGLDLWEHARLFALLNTAVSDSSISVFDSKYTHNFWRPVTAIRQADLDHNPATVPDAGWEPFLPTPPYPDYTCGLTTNVGAGMEILRRFFGTDDIGYTHSADGTTRSYQSLSEAAAESVDARVFAGIHFRTGCERGIRQGAQVGRFVIMHHLKPLTPGRGAAQR